MVGDALIPMMLLSLGVRLFEVRWTTGASALSAASSARSPASRLRRCWRRSSTSTTQQGLLILFGSLPPAVLNFMVAEQFRQEPGKVASIVLIGNLLSIVFVPLGLSIALRG